jgi:hypothetical protein
MLVSDVVGFSSGTVSPVGTALGDGKGSDVDSSGTDGELLDIVGEAFG